MNGARSTFMRKGFLLTALAAAVLLAASSGTAYAQSIGFRRDEFHSMDGGRIPRHDKTPNPIMIDINVSGLTSPSEGVVGDLRRLALVPLTLDAHRRRCLPWAIGARSGDNQPDLAGFREFSSR